MTFAKSVSASTSGHETQNTLPSHIRPARAADARAQSATPNPPQPAKRYSSLEDDPQFKRLSPEQQDVVRKAMQNINTAVTAEQKNGAKTIPPAQAGCDASPVKKPRFHIPKAVQEAINKQAKQIGSRTGVDVDPNAPAKTVNDAQQKLPPCPPAPAAANNPAKK